MRISDWSSDVCSSDLWPIPRPWSGRFSVDRRLGRGQWHPCWHFDINSYRNYKYMPKNTQFCRLTLSCANATLYADAAIVSFEWMHQPDGTPAAIANRALVNGDTILAAQINQAAPSVAPRYLDSQDISTIPPQPRFATFCTQ